MMRSAPESAAAAISSPVPVVVARLVDDQCRGAAVDQHFGIASTMPDNCITHGFDYLVVAEKAST